MWRSSEVPDAQAMLVIVTTSHLGYRHVPSAIQDIPSSHEKLRKFWFHFQYLSQVLATRYRRGDVKVEGDVAFFVHGNRKHFIRKRVQTWMRDEIVLKYR